MAEASGDGATERYALVTGGNKGIGFEICRQLASTGIVVILTSRNESRGIEAVERLKELGLSNCVAFHQLDVLDVASIGAAAEFVKTKYGRLDILVNNAGTAGIGVNGDVTVIQELIEGDVASVFATGQPELAVQLKADATLIEPYNGAEECVQTNYYGAKRVTEALIPLLQLSSSPRIVNVSSLLGNLKLLQNERAKSVLSDEASLSEERIDEVVQQFLKNFKEGRLEENQWPAQVRAYKVSKAALNAYTRVVAKKHTSFCINCLCPGFARTDITCNLGPLSPSEAAESAVRLALLPDGGPSGAFFYRKDVYSF
ncbi:Rossmann-fold superfamily protein [Perilla frutescens var. hirtella]|nr:Rossmann-fold superfamily protein [Perilla frutescens var. hirtella]KAH6817882.1 Rossmann-fold superfamily protein [Perilla frutescens var. frutescens]